jgi:multifunctional cyclase/dehydratase/O-methyltransferase
MRQILDDTETGDWAGFPDLAHLPSHVRVLFLLLLRRGADAVMLAAELNIADHLAERPRTASELAELTGCHPESLRRILLTAAALGIFAERPDGRFVLTETAECLRTDAEISLRDLAVHAGNLSALNPLDELRQTVRTGVDAFRRKYGKKLYEVFADHPELSEPFNRAMTQTARMSAESVANFGNFQRFKTVADIGGGQGQLIGEIVRKHPDLRGILFDFPNVTKGAADLLALLGVADRVTVMSGDFRDGLPAGADAYIFHRVLGGWEDPQITETLKRVHSEIGDQPHARLIIADPILPPPNQFHPGRLFDIDVM